MNASSMRVAATCALLATTCLSTFVLASPALAQNADVPSAYKNIDENGVDLTDGSFNFSLVEGSIGSGEGALSLVRYDADGSSLDNWEGLSLILQGATATVTLGDRSETFTNLQPDQANGATLTGGGSYYTYRDSGGTEIVFASPEGAQASTSAAYCSTDPNARCVLAARSVREPNGKTVALRWDVGDDCGGVVVDVGDPPPCAKVKRLADVANNLGYGLAVAYSADTTAGTPEWFKRVSVTFRNSAMPGSPTPTVLYAEPAPGVTEITTTGGRTWRITTDGDGRITGIKRPGAAGDSTQVTYGANGVSQVTHEGVTTNYARTVNVDATTTVVSDALGTRRTVVSNLASGRPTQIVDALGNSTLFQYDGNDRLTEVTAPEGNKVITSYDARGNVTQSIARAKPPIDGAAPLADIVAQAGYDETCANAAVCNQPRWTQDAAGARTNYDYDTAGHVTAVRAPAPAAGAARPETRYTYSPFLAQDRGTLTLLTGVSACRTGASCIGTADEVRTTIEYGLFNRQPVAVASGAGDGSLTARTTLAHDPIGNLIEIDGPLTDAADVSRIHYNAAREVVGTIGPDPDGAGPLKHRAQLFTRNADGDVTVTLTGTAAGQSDNDLGGMSALEAAHVGYDAHRRPVYRSRDEGGVVTGAMSQSYDARGRPDCTMLRMDPARFATPADPCAPSPAGPHGPDRVTRTLYDAMDQPTQRIVAVGTPDEASEASATYTPNGQISALVDANGNTTDYAYDAHGRLSRTSYPVQAPGAEISNASDYEELTYDARSNVTQVRLRDGQVIALGHDALGRLTSKTAPGGAFFEKDAVYAYDNLGRLTEATYPGSFGIAFGYDALGRKTSEASIFGTTRSEYDLAGRRTRLTWRDGFAVDYRYLVTGEMSAIREAGGFQLAGFAYDDRGRRTSLTRGNGTETSYSYDLGSRLSLLGVDMSGTAHDQALTFGYNPASQIVETGRSNDAFAFSGSAAGDVGSSVNGLNQLTSVGGGSIEHDARGNLTRRGASKGADLFGYTAENRLATKWLETRNGDIISVVKSTDLAYDPLGRLFHISSTGTDLRYDGTQVIEESAAYTGEVRRRYVHGPGVDEPLVSYDAAGNRRYLHADERGSIVATSDQAGNAIHIARYDEYGMPQGEIADRFGYTGQMWLPEVGVHSYKARMYDPRLGRFLQSDPIGYAAGMNLYAYVEADPVNFTDPSGLQAQPVDGSDCTDEHGAFGTFDKGICVVPEIVITGQRPRNPVDFGGFDLGPYLPDFSAGGGPLVLAAPQSDLKRCLMDVGGALAKGALDPIGVLANGAAAIAVGAGYEVNKYNRTAGGVMGRTKLAPPGGSINRLSIARAGGIIAGKLFVAGTVIVAGGYALHTAATSKNCRSK